MSPQHSLPPSFPRRSSQPALPSSSNPSPPSHSCLQSYRLLHFFVSTSTSKADSSHVYFHPAPITGLPGPPFPSCSTACTAHGHATSLRSPFFPQPSPELLSLPAFASSAAPTSCAFCPTGTLGPSVLPLLLTRCSLAGLVHKTPPLVRSTQLHNVSSSRCSGA